MRRLLFILLGVSALALASGALPGDAHASFSGENGRFAFKWEPSDWESIVITRPDGSVIQKLRARCWDVCHVEMGDWSPNGRRLVFVSNIELGQKKLVTVHPDGRGRKVLFRYGGFMFSAVWSPDGSRLAFSVMTGLGLRPHYIVYVVNRDGSHLQRLTRAASRNDLDWSSRDRIVFPRHGDLFTIRPDGSGLRQVTHTDAKESQPDWAPGGRRLTYVRHGEIWKIRASGENASRVAASGASPTWAPDGSLIAFISERDGAIHTVRPSGGAETVIANPMSKGFLDALAWQSR